MRHDKLEKTILEQNNDHTQNISTIENRNLENRLLALPYRLATCTANLKWLLALP